MIADYLAGLVAAVLSYVAPGFLPPSLRGPVRPNHRGRMIPVILGTAVTASLCTVMVVGFVGDEIGGRTEFGWLWTIVALVLVYAAGRYDDLQTERHRGVVRDQPGAPQVQRHLGSRDVRHDEVEPPAARNDAGGHGVQRRRREGSEADDGIGR